MLLDNQEDPFSGELCTHTCSTGIWHNLPRGRVTSCTALLCTTRGCWGLNWTVVNQCGLRQKSVITFVKTHRKKNNWDYLKLAYDLVFFEVIILSLLCENFAEIIAARQNIFSTAISLDIRRICITVEIYSLKRRSCWNIFCWLENTKFVEYMLGNLSTALH